MKKKLILLCVFILISSFLNAVDFSDFILSTEYCKEDIPGHEKDIQLCKEIVGLYLLVLISNKDISTNKIRNIAKKLHYVDKVLLRLHNHSDYNFLNKFVLTKTTSFTKYINLLPSSMLDKEKVSKRSEWYWANVLMDLCRMSYMEMIKDENQNDYIEVKLN